MSKAKASCGLTLCVQTLPNFKGWGWTEVCGAVSFPEGIKTTIPCQWQRAVCGFFGLALEDGSDMGIRFHLGWTLSYDLGGSQPEPVLQSAQLQVSSSLFGCWLCSQGTGEVTSVHDHDRHPPWQSTDIYWETNPFLVTGGSISLSRWVGASLLRSTCCGTLNLWCRHFGKWHCKECSHQQVVLSSREQFLIEVTSCHLWQMDVSLMGVLSLLLTS